MRTIPLVLLLAACQSYAWFKSGATEREFRMERAQCLERANSISNSSQIQRGTVFDNCMEGKGWEWRAQ